MFRTLAAQKESRLKEGHLLPDHVHILIAIPPKHAVSQVVGFMKGKSAIHLARVYGERARNFVGQHFRARGFFVSTVGRDETVIRQYIKRQEAEDTRLEQLGLWMSEATAPVAPGLGGRVSGPRIAALSGSHTREPPAVPGDCYRIPL